MVLPGLGTEFRYGISFFFGTLENHFDGRTPVPFFSFLSNRVHKKKELRPTKSRSTTSHRKEDKRDDPRPSMSADDPDRARALQDIEIDADRDCCVRLLFRFGVCVRPSDFERFVEFPKSGGRHGHDHPAGQSKSIRRPVRPRPLPPTRNKRRTPPGSTANI